MEDDDVVQEDWQEVSEYPFQIDYEEGDGMDLVTDMEYRKDYPTLEPTHDYSGENVPVFPDKPVDDTYEGPTGAAGPIDPSITLNEEQQLGVEMILDLVDTPPSKNADKAGILLGLGGTGKSTVIQDVQHKVEAKYERGSVLKLATSGVAATVIGGSTVHSSRRGLSLPVRTIFQELGSTTLKHLQKTVCWEGQGQIGDY